MQTVNRADALIQRGKLKKLNNNKKAPIMGAFFYVYFKMYIKNLIVIPKNICLYFSVIYIVSTLTRETYILYVLSYFFKKEDIQYVN